MLDEAAVALLRASTVLPRGSMRLARLLAAAQPSLKCYPARTKYGRLFCDVTESSCFALATKGEFTRWKADEEATAAIPLDRQSIVFDIGANIGVMTRIFAERAGHVHAFEPSPRALALLRLNVPPNSTIHPFALGEEEGVVAFAECEALTCRTSAKATSKFTSNEVGSGMICSLREKNAPGIKASVKIAQVTTDLAEHPGLPSARPRERYLLPPDGTKISAARS
jgi:FkbM family methyltransferase